MKSGATMAGVNLSREWWGNLTKIVPPFSGYSVCSSGWRSKLQWKWVTGACEGGEKRIDCHKLDAK